MPLPNHGSPNDRGGADSYYRRPRSPHWWPEGTCHGTMVGYKDMTPEQIDDYNEGFDDNEARGDFKDWGYEEDDHAEPCNEQDQD